MSLLKAIIVDDEPDSTSLLRLQLERHCPQITAINIFNSSRKALEEIEVLNPDLVFLDIEMPEINGFELLEKLMPFRFAVVFVTAYNQYALKAFRFNALDYLVKPVEVNDLIAVVNKVGQQVRPINMHQLEQMQTLMRGAPITKIAVPSHTGISFIELNDIMYVEANNNYSKLLLKDGNNFILSKTLKDIQDVLEESHFLRIHRQYIVNLNHVKHFNKNEGILTMVDKAMLPVARSQKDKLIQKYDWL
ncbi:LytR/AlgR family response regulator transcription factor [Chitinophagaceae bacterium LWZ2-11]